jgi:lipid-binding SYLF domain-containing protein
MKIINLILLGIFLVTSSAVAKTTDEQQLLRKAGYVLQEVLESPDIEIPEALIKRAKAVIVFPTMIKGGFMIAARYGKGVVAVRSPKTGKFGPPAFVYTAGGSFGFQIGAEAVDLVLLVMSPRGIEGLLKNKFTLGADAAITVGPVGRHAEAGADILMQGEIYSYSRSKGAFAGVSLKGAVISSDRDANWDYYNEPITSEEILLFSKVKKLPESGKRYIRALNMMFPPTISGRKK